MARQIARLQLPVLRAALGDPSFFSSRRTRCGASSTASPRWATASTTSATSGAQTFLAKVRPWCRSRRGRLRPDRDLRAEAGGAGSLRRRAGRQATCRPRGRRHRAAVRKGRPAAAAPAVCAALAGDLKDWTRRPSCATSCQPVWSQVLLRRPTIGGATATRRSACGRRPRAVHERAAQDHAGAAQGLPGRLPKLMQELNEGMNLIGWPESAAPRLLRPADAGACRGAEGPDGRRSTST
jgi:hypothetical protein